MKFQREVGFPTMEVRVFRTVIVDKETGKKWPRYIPAESPLKAERKATEAIKLLAEHDDHGFWLRQKAVAVATFEPRFDGNEFPLTFYSEDGHNYVAGCPGSGINLNFRMLGGYPECKSCSQKEVCSKEAEATRARYE